MDPFKLDMCNLLWRRYQEKGIQDYQFRVSEDVVLDATMRGGLARFINHSCDPNCCVSIKTTEEVLVSS